MIRVDIWMETEEGFGDTVADELDRYLYGARVTGLVPGSYQLVVRHKGDSFPPDSHDGWITVLERRVRVPAAE